MKLVKNTRLLFILKKRETVSLVKNYPHDFLYGFDEVSKKIATKPLFIEDYQLHHYHFKIIEKLIARKSRLGIYFQAFLNNKDKINSTDILFSPTDGAGFGLLFFKLFAKFNNKVIVLIQALHDRYKYFKNNRPLIWFYKKMLGQAELVLTLSPFEKKLLIKLFKLNPNKVEFLPFAPDLEFWNGKSCKNKKIEEDFILTLGNDMHRDYDFLLKNYDLNIKLKLITKILNRNQLKKIKTNPLFHHDFFVSHHKLRQAYRQASFVIVPLKVNTLSTAGLSVALQAMAMERPVLAAGIPALKSLFKNNFHICFYQPGSSRSFKKELNRLFRNKQLQAKLAKNGRQLVEKEFSIRKMGNQLAKII